MTRTIAPLAALAAALILCLPTFAAPLWHSAASLYQIRNAHTATALPDGNVLVAGGESYSSGVDFSTATAEVYSSAKGRWLRTGSMHRGREHATATMVDAIGCVGVKSCPQVLVVGGYSNGFIEETAELWNPQTGAWTYARSMAVPRSLHTATLIQTPSGPRVLVVGGAMSGGAATPSAELYNPLADTWTPTGSMSVGRARHTASLLADGRVLVSGGSAPTAAGSAEIYDPVSGTWSPTGALRAPRWDHTATVMQDGQVLVAGGYFGMTPLTRVELYDPSTGSWTEQTPLVTPRSQHTATLLPNGTVLVAGGFGTGTSVLRSAELFEPFYGWRSAGDMINLRAMFTATPITLGGSFLVLMAAGEGAGIATNDAELFNYGAAF